MPAFRAVIEATGGGGHAVLLPADAAESLGARHLLRVRGSLDGAAFRSNLVKSGDQFYLGVHKATLEAASRQAGDEAQLELEVDVEPR